ncbi:type II toxin-antitoxin system toxin, partial [Bacillus cereus]|nr:type II toxin-antitoxin system toxin [Bacillus cereus]
DGKGDFCEIETIELVDLIHIWQDKQKEFKKGKNKELK